MKWNAWSFYWFVVWFLCGFGIPETIALIRNQANTLSYQVWHLEGIDLQHLMSPTHWTAVHFFIFAGCVWLVLHFAFGLFR